jgi:hypothetical protein
MMGTLIFGRDARLYIRRLVPDSVHPRQPRPELLPLDAVEAGGGPGLLPRLTSPIEIETGTTAGALLLALAPWSALLGEIGQFDLDAFLAEARAPFAPREGRDALSNLEILPKTLLRRPVLAPEATPWLELTWDFLARYHTPQPDGFGGQQEHTTVLYEPLTRWSGLPIVLRTDAMLVDETCPDLPPRPIRVPQPSLFDAVIVGMLLEIANDESPAKRDRRRLDILRDMS